MLPRIKRIAGNQGQNLIEYGLILGIVTVALLGMQAYFKRGVQSVVKVATDDYAGYRKQGEPVGKMEMAIKKKIYEVDKKVMMRSENTGSWVQTITNKGEGNIRSELKGSSTTTADSVWIGGDYRTRRLQDTKEVPAGTSN